RVDGNAIVIPDTSVSRQHAAVLVGSSVVEVRDNGSSNGTFVNGERIVNRTLAGGDVVAFGNVEFDFSVSGDEAGAFPQLSALLGGKTAGQLAVVLAGATVVVLVGVLLYLLWPSGSDDQVLVSEQELRFERNLDSTLKRAEETFDRAEWSEARTLFDEVLRDDPIHVRAREGRQRAAENQKHKLSLDAARRAFSEKLYRKAITHAREIPSNSHYAEQGVALTSDAQRQLARIVAKVVETECSAGEWQKCYAATVEHMRLIPESSDYSAQMTRAASELKKAGVEVEIFTKPSTTDDLSIFKMYQEPLLRRAVVKLSEGKAEEAIAVCRNAVTQAPESAQARQVLRILSDLQMERHAADTATQSLNIRSAIEHWRHALNLHDQLVPASSVSVVRNKIRLAIGNQLFSLGQTAFSRNMFAESFQYWDQGVRVNPTNPNLKKGLKRLEDQAKLTLSSVDEGTPEACVPLRQVLLTTARSSPVHKRAFAKLANSNCPG
ncbi:MAG: FHA domain-containing protein, partial [Myxococcota bacterium]